MEVAVLREHSMTIHGFPVVADVLQQAMRKIISQFFATMQAVLHLFVLCYLSTRLTESKICFGTRPAKVGEACQSRDCTP